MASSGIEQQFHYQMFLYTTWLKKYTHNFSTSPSNSCMLLYITFFILQVKCLGEIFPNEFKLKPLFYNIMPGSFRHYLLDWWISQDWVFSLFFGLVSYKNCFDWVHFEVRIVSRISYKKNAKIEFSDVLRTFELLLHLESNLTEIWNIASIHKGNKSGAFFSKILSTFDFMPILHKKMLENNNFLIFRHFFV